MELHSADVQGINMSGIFWAAVLCKVIQFACRSEFVRNAKQDVYILKKLGHLYCMCFSREWSSVSKQQTVTVLITLDCLLSFHVGC